MYQRPTTSPHAAHTVSRRAVATGLAWAAPAAAFVAASPALAASRSQLTAQNTTLQMYQKVYTKTPTSCSAGSNPQVGYINTLCCNSPARDTAMGNRNDSDCRQDPASSIGIWVEGGTGGQASIDSARITYSFNYPVSFDNASVGTAGTSYFRGTTVWSGGNMLQPGWSIESTTSTSITLVYSGSGAVDVSTSAVGSGFCTGYFIPFHATSGCYLSGALKVTTTRQVYWSDANGQHLYSRTTGPSGI
ncbi:hypothetical protein [Micrococcus sp.]|uniref:hypothetical protein n=1 Tax=Micrococcus sp. TaxID=1271 RepID=UPI002A916BCF|nr:hypothetical protein [Micrococcus sp.]MDY6055356.1 hypothetical protein [Micrococcus sp.]